MAQIINPEHIDILRPFFVTRREWNAYNTSLGAGDITSVTAGSGLTGGGASGDVTLDVNPGDGIEIVTDAVAVDLSATSGLEFDTGELQLADSIAGAGLAIASKVLAVGAGDGIDVAADTVAVDVTDIIDTNYGLTENTNDIRINLAASGGLAFSTGALTIDLDTTSGLGLAAGGLSVGAGDGIDVLTSTIAVDVTDLIGTGLQEEATNNIAVNYTTVATALAGDGLVDGTGVIDLGTPSTLTVSTSNAVTTSSHTHAITSSSNPGAAASLLASNASGYLQLVRLGLGVAPSYPLHIQSTTLPLAYINNASGAAELALAGTNANGKAIYLQTGTSKRWRIWSDDATEAGANQGSNFEIARYSDAGALIDTPFEIPRLGGGIKLNNSTYVYADLEVQTTTTPQFQIIYDGSNWSDISVAADGALTLDTTGTDADIFLIPGSGDVQITGELGIGVAPSYPLHVQSTTQPQFRLAYDGSFQADFDVDNFGSLDITLNGANAEFNVEAADGVVFDVPTTKGVVISDDGTLSDGGFSLRIQHASAKHFLLEYDSSNYAHMWVASDGHLTFDTTGTDPDLSLSPSESLYLVPDGNVYLNPTGNSVLPDGTYKVNIGALDDKYLSLHVAELWAETLVAQETLATIGGRILVGSTTRFTQDLTAAATTIYVENSVFEQGDVIYMEKGLRVEFMAVTSDATESPELLSNPGFETAGGGGADIWANWTENAGTGTLSNETGIPYLGADAAKMTAGASTDTYVDQNATVTANTRYRLSFWSRGDGTYSGRFSVYDVTGSTDIITLTSTGNTSATYVRRTVYFNTPNGCTSVRIRFQCPDTNTGVCYFDNGYYPAWGVTDKMLSKAEASYTVTRDLDGTGANDWYVGDAIFNTGKHGDGFIDLYSVSGVGDTSAIGPTIVGNVRNTTELLSNGGFETLGGGGADVFASWSENAGDGSISAETTVVRTGTYSAKLTQGASLNTYIESAAITVTAETDYVLIYYGVGDYTATGQYRIYDVSNTAEIVTWTNGGHFQQTWSLGKVTKAFTTPSGCTSVRIDFRPAQTNGKIAYFDDATVKEVVYNGWVEHWAIGNLNGVYGYSADTYGVGLGEYGDDHIVIDATNGIRFRDSSDNVVAQLTGATWTIGNTTSDHINISSSAFQIKDSSTVRGEWQTDGDIFIGSDISAPATTYLSVFAQAQTYNTESMAAGDMLIGDNSASKANVLWDKSAGKLLFRAAQTTTLHIDTAGALLTGASGGTNIVKLDGNGIAIDVGTSFDTDKSYKIQTSTFATTIGKLSGWYTTNGTTEWSLRLDATIGTDDAYINLGKNTATGMTINIVADNDIKLDAPDIRYTGDLIAERTANHTGYIYVPLQDYETLESTNSTSSGTDTAVDTPSGGNIPAEAKAIAVRVFCEGAAQGDWVAYGPDSDGDSSRYHIACYSQGASSDYNGNNGILNINASTQRRVYRARQVTSGTLTWTTLIVGYFI